MLLKNKIAVIYGSGSIGSAVTLALAHHGAKVFIAARNAATMDAIYSEIKTNGGSAAYTTANALDEVSVNHHLDVIVKEHGRIDISFNAINVQDVQGIPLVDMRTADFMQPINIAMKTQFITATAAARHMKKQGSGVILSITATPAGVAYPLVGGFGPACSAIEGFSRNLAAELGPFGVRAICLRSAGSPDSEVFKKFMASEYALAKTAVKELENDTMLGRLPSLADIAHTAVFAVSDMAAGMTGTALNVTCGTTRD